MSRPRDAHDDAPGRIPESLIHAALDGEVSEDMQREIASALKYDKTRHRELLDTADAIRALRHELDAPDLSGAILGQLDRGNRFIPRSWQRHVRTGRMAVAAGLLVSLMGVAVLQRAYPRWSSIAEQPTPVNDVAEAVGCDTMNLERSIRDEMQRARASVFPTPTIRQPGRTDFAYSVSLEDPASPSGGLGRPDFAGEDDARLLIRASERFGSVRTVSWSRSWSMPGVLGGLGGDGPRDTDLHADPVSEPLELP